MADSNLETNQITQNLSDETAQLVTQALQTGTTLLSRYVIQDTLGVGGMGAVYRARDMHFPNVVKVVAVKEMVIQARDTLVRSTIVRNFEREANLLATLDHPAIPRIYDYFTQNERSYLVLEYINGKDLEAVLNETDDFIPSDKIIRWAVELCDVLSYLHNHKPEPIVFRDMKPSNVMVDQYNHIVLIDFGIAKPFQGPQRGTMIGTEGYSPPEQYRGEASPLADIYALGATLHHLLTRRDPRLEPPFSFSERPISQINPDCSQKLMQVVEKALQYSPADRYQSAPEMKDALMAVAKQSGVLVQPPSVKSAPTQASIEKNTVWEFACEDEIRGSPTYANGIIYVGSYDNNLYALDSDTGQFVWKYPTDGGIVSKPAIYENAVYFGSEDKRLHVVSTRYGKIAWSYYTEGPVRSSPHIAEGHVFIGSDDGRLHAVNTLSGRQAWTLDAGAPIRSTPVVVQDMVYFGTEAGELYCVDYRSAIKWRFKAKRAITSSPVFSQGVIYFGSIDSTLYAIDAKSGWVIWRYRLGKPTISTPCLADELVFTGATDGVIYCVDSKTSKEVWRYATEHQVTGSPVIHNDALYCGSVDGHLYCLEYRTGRLRWKYRTSAPITGTPAAHDDLIYIGSTDHRIYALMA
ncbi:MAG: protein kinase [Chloroflexi bacterium RBG_16_52_11]|nr:MAG: protein kinase [Chloroflexi bacterium RBG_16_52_11]